MPRRAVLAQLDRIMRTNAGQFTDYDLVHLAMHFGVSGQAMSLRLVTLRRTAQASPSRLLGANDPLSQSPMP